MRGVDHHFRIRHADIAQIVEHPGGFRERAETLRRVQEWRPGLHLRLPGNGEVFFGREAQSMAFLSTPGIEWLYYATCRVLPQCG
jgi:hypothetical protein